MTDQQNRHAKKLSLRLAALFGVMAAGGAQAAWVTDGALRLDSRYDDNVALSSTDEEGSSITTAHGELEVRQVTENSEVSVIGGANYVAYGESQAGDTELDNKDVEYIDLRSHYDTERTTYGLRGSGRRDVTLATVGFIRDPIDITTGGAASGGTTTEPPGTPTAGNPTGTAGDPLGAGTLDGASVDKQVRRYDVIANPYIEYELSERTTVQFDYVYSSLDYRNADQTDLEDSQTNAVRLELRQRVTERDLARFRVGAARMDPETSSNSDAYQATGGWEHRFSEETGISADAGASYRDRDGETDVGFVFTVRGFRRTEVGDMFVQVQRSLTPTGFGELSETDRLTLGMRRNLSDTVQLTVNGDSYSASNSDGNDRSYISVGPQIRWMFSPSFSLGGTYRYAWADREGEPGGAASGNSVGVFIEYRPGREI